MKNSVTLSTNQRHLFGIRNSNPKRISRELWLWWSWAIPSNTKISVTSPPIKRIWKGLSAVDAFQLWGLFVEPWDRNLFIPGKQWGGPSPPLKKTHQGWLRGLMAFFNKFSQTIDEYSHGVWFGVGGSGRTLSGGQRRWTITVAGSGMAVPPLTFA